MARKTNDEIRKIVDSLVRKVGTRCPFKIAEYLGIIIICQPMADLDGMWLQEKRIKAIILNKFLSSDRQRLVCAHELGHAIMHADINSSFMRTYTRLSTNRYEVEANFFSFELEFSGFDEDDTIDNIVERYGLNKYEIKLMNTYLEGQR